MNENPYTPPDADQHPNMRRDERVLRRMIATLKQWRTRPPTFANSFFSLRMWRMLLIFGIVGAASVYFIEAIGVPSECSYLACGMCLGGAFANIGMIRRIALNWRIQEPLMDWVKIDALAHGMNI